MVDLWNYNIINLLHYLLFQNQNKDQTRKLNNLCINQKKLFIKKNTSLIRSIFFILTN